MALTSHFRSLVKFVGSYWFWIIALLMLNVLVWVLTEAAYGPYLNVQHQQGELWSVRMYLASGLLLFDNLCALWWYAHSTQEQKQAAQQQLQLAGKDYIERNKPVVYSDRWEDPDRKGAYHYIIRNVGGGFALNVYFVEPGRLPVALGALAAGAERRLPSDLNDELVKAWTGAMHILIAEGPFSRTTQWTATLNYRIPDNVVAGGQVEHKHGIPHVEPPRHEHQSLADYWRKNGAHLCEQLNQLHQEPYTWLEVFQQPDGETKKQGRQ